MLVLHIRTEVTHTGKGFMCKTSTLAGAVCFLDCQMTTQERDNTPIAEDLDLTAARVCAEQGFPLPERKLLRLTREFLNDPAEMAKLLAALDASRPETE